MTESLELATRGQQSLDEQLFSRFVNLKVGMSLSGSQQFPAEDLLELAGEGRLEKGREVTVTARFFVADSGLGITRSPDYNGEATYGFGSGKVALKLIAIESLQVGEQKLTGNVAKLCACAIRGDIRKDRKEGYKGADARGWLSRCDCEVCGGRGLLYPREYDAPYAKKVYHGWEPTLILVDELIEPKPVPEGRCPLCAEELPVHSYECPESQHHQRGTIADGDDGTEADDA